MPRLSSAYRSGPKVKRRKVGAVASLVAGDAERRAYYDLELERCKPGVLKMVTNHGRIPAILMIRTIHPEYGLKAALDLLNKWEGK